jgi:hypothetical protein
MYKVFFKDRTVYFGDDFSRAFVRNKGLFYRFSNFQELHELVEVFYDLKQIRNLYIFHEDILMVLEQFKSCFRIIEAGGGLVRNNKGEFLVIERNGLWDLPKGKLKRGEDLETAALREVEEETGLRVQSAGPITATYHTYQASGERILKKTRWFEMTCSGREKIRLQADEGITDYRWFRSGETDFIRQRTYPSILDVLFIRGIL